MLRAVNQKSLIFDWGNVVLSMGYSLRHAFRRATSLKEGGKADILLRL